MREIKFRGKRIDNGEWTYGAPYFLKIEEEEPEDCVNKSCIITGVDWDASWGFLSPDNNCFKEIIPETVGQFTGIKDCDKNEIFEGDIVLYDGIQGIVCFEDGMFIVRFDYTRSIHVLSELEREIKVIGNIHDK